MNHAQLLNESPGVQGDSFITITLLLAWLAAILVLISSGAYHSQGIDFPVVLVLSLVFPVAAFGLGLLLSPAVRDYVLRFDLRLLILVHAWRTVGLGFVMLYSLDLLPGLFALTAGLGDVLTAITAVFLATALFRHAGQVDRQWIARWNLFGLTDFILAVSLGLLTRKGMPLHTGTGPSSDMMSDFPLVLIPAFVVPLLVITHMMIFVQLKHAQARP